LAEEGSEMSFCLGAKGLVGGRLVAPKPQDACAQPRGKIMGRPITSEPRTHQLNLSLTSRELASIRRRAAAVGMRPVHFGRALLLDMKSRPVGKTETKSNIDRLAYDQLVRLGNNLNQMVRHMHQTGDPLPADLEPLLRDIRQIIARRCDDDR
jgi:hypothetical protein